MYELLLEELGAECLLENLTRALSSNELNECLQYIARMYDIEIEGEE